MMCLAFTKISVCKCIPTFMQLYTFIELYAIEWNPRFTGFRFSSTSHRTLLTKYNLLKQTLNILDSSHSRINGKQSELGSNMELVYNLTVYIKGSNIVIEMQINIVEISHNCNRMSSSYDFASLYSITLSSCCASAADLLGDINIQLQKLSNQIKFLLYFL